jgi:uncharacterized SAM-binding protein YcdF (DUF218 family)
VTQRGHWRRGLAVVRLALICAGAVLVLAMTPIPRALAHAWATNASPRHADAIVVLGAGVRWPGYLPCAALYRLEHGIRLYRAGYAPRLILTGGADPRHPSVDSEASVMRTTALELGVRSQDIIVETNATRTYENAQHVARLMSQQAWTSAIIVTDALHMRRAQLVFQRVGVRAYPSAGRTSELEGGGAGNGLLILGRLAHELGGLVIYKLRGWV